MRERSPNRQESTSRRQRGRRWGGHGRRWVVSLRIGRMPHMEPRFERLWTISEQFALEYSRNPPRCAREDDQHGEDKDDHCVLDETRTAPRCAVGDRKRKRDDVIPGKWRRRVPE